MIEESIENFKNAKSRKFTILHLEVRALDGWDIFFLAIYTIAIGAHLYFQHFDNKYWVYSLVWISMWAWCLTTSTPYGIRFRNIYFFFIWLLLSFVFISPSLYLSYLPLATFVLYQGLRLYFWKTQKREFIPFTAVRRGYYRYVSKTEGRTGGIKDKRLMKVLFWLGMILFLTSLFGMFGKDLSTPPKSFIFQLGNGFFRAPSALTVLTDILSH
jgi:hypothetical protein